MLRMASCGSGAPMEFWTTNAMTTFLSRRPDEQPTAARRSAG
jgi:hypothetical protein